MQKNFKPIQSVNRVLDILELFLKTKDELGISEIAAQLDLSKSTAYGLAATLESRGYLRQNPKSEKYTWGLKIVELGMQAYQRLDVRKAIKPQMYQLSAKYKDTIHLFIRDGNYVICIDAVLAGDGAVGVLPNIGKRKLLHRSSIGKLYLSEMGPEERHDYYSSPEFREAMRQRDVKIADLEKELIQVSSQDYAMNDVETQLGFKSIGVPCRDYSGAMIAGICITSLKLNLDEERVEEILRDLKAAASESSAQFGYSQRS